MKKGIFFLLGLTTVVIYSCSKDTAASSVDCSKVSAKFAADVKPILTGSKCNNANCHPSNGSLADYAAIKGHFDEGHLKKEVIDNKSMPPAGNTPLTADEYNKISCWISAGALNN